MEYTRCKQILKYSDGRELIDNKYPLHYLEPGSEVRIGFQKGTLKRAEFQLHNGNTIIYEDIQD